MVWPPNSFTTHQHVQHKLKYVKVLIHTMPGISYSCTRNHPLFLSEAYLPKKNPGDTVDCSATMEPASRYFKIFNCKVALRIATLLRPLNKTRSTLFLTLHAAPRDRCTSIGTESSPNLYIHLEAQHLILNT